MIKFLDITKQDKKIHKIIFNDIKKIIKKNNFILGEDVFKFEKNFAKYCNVKYAIGCANGTDALTIALKVLNIPKGSEVIIPAMTYCSTAFAVLNAGLKPVLVDIDHMSSSISIKDIKNRITKKTRVIMPVHLYGSAVDIDKINEIIKNKKIIIIDDCSQAHGALYKGKKIGSLGTISCFSLYPGKNLGAYGDAGVITTNNEVLYRKISNFRNLGSDKKFIHNQVGFNSRLDTIQAAILNRKLPLLTKNNNKKRKIAKLYDKGIDNLKIEKIYYADDSVYHQYVIMTKKRSLLIKLLEKHNIPFGMHYPKAIHQLEIFKKYFKKENFKNAEKIAKESLSLPIDPNLEKKHVDKIISILNSF